jgi:XTP/dITP diphosphohydrolase
MVKIKLIFATKNLGKIKEVKEIFKNTEFEVVSMQEEGININVVEDGDTLEYNAIKKAVTIMEATNSIVISDDSGLEIDYLDKKPGVNSANFLGELTPYTVRNKEIIQLLKGVEWEKRTARFKTVIAVAFPKGDTIITKGELEGFIAKEVKGEKGFGYDPIFYLPKYGTTLGDTSLDIKNKISHRSKALKLMKVELDKKVSDKLL